MMEFKMDNQFMLDCLKELIDTPSPVSYYEEINPVIEKYGAMFDLPVTYDRKHTAYITLDGEDNSKTVMVGGHLDTLGMVVRRIDDDGCIRIRQLGGLNFCSLEGETVHVVTREGKKYSGLMVCQSHSVHVFDDAKTLTRDEKSMIVVLDEDVHSEKEVKELGIQHGDIISLEPHFTVTDNGYIKSRFIDDKACAACALAVLKAMKEQELVPSCSVWFAFPYYEEIGHGGSYVPEEVSQYIALDIGVLGPDHAGSEKKVSICVKDNFSPYDRELTDRLITCARDAGVDFVEDVFYRYSTDANAAVRAGNNVQAAAFGMGTFSSHGMERTHVQAVMDTAKLLAAFIL